MNIPRIVGVISFCGVVFYTMLSVSFAETVVLKSGKRLEGTVVRSTEHYIELDYKGSIEIIFLDDIAQMAPVSPADPAAAEPAGMKGAGAAATAAGDETPEDHVSAPADLQPGDPEYKAISDICENFFTHLFDDDIRAWSGDVSDTFRDVMKARLSVVRIENPALLSSSLAEFRVVSLKGNDKQAEGVFSVTRKSRDGRTLTHDMRVVLFNMDGTWKIHDARHNAGQ